MPKDYASHDINRILSSRYKHENSGQYYCNEGAVSKLDTLSCFKLHKDYYHEAEGVTKEVVVAVAQRLEHY
jgi:hypothetical protein